MEKLGARDFLGHIWYFLTWFTVWQVLDYLLETIKAWAR